MRFKSKILPNLIIVIILLNSGCIFNSDNNNEKSSNTVEYQYNINVDINKTHDFEIYIPAIFDDNKNPLKINNNLFNNPKIINQELINTVNGWAIKIKANGSFKINFENTYKFKSEGHYYKMSLENESIEKEKNDDGELIVKYWIYFNSTQIEYANISINFNFEKSTHIQKIHISGEINNGWNQIEGGKLELSD